MINRVFRRWTNGKRPSKAVIQDPRALISGDLETLERVLRKYLQGSGTLLKETTEHILGQGGKRIRPVLVLLSGRASGYSGRRLLPMAASMELVHTATLVHDDVIDEAPTRRGRPSINSKWGNQTSVVLGDYIFASALLHITTDGLGRRTLPIIARTVLRLCSGEMREIETEGDLNLSEKDYLSLVEDKTAILMETCCKLGSLYSGASLGVRRRLARFGRAYGMAFQILDDLMDVYSSEEVTKKSIGRDVKQGHLTLPLILALSTAKNEKREALEKLIREKNFGGLKQILGELGALEKTRAKLKGYLDYARDQVRAVGENDAVLSMIALVDELEAQAAGLSEISLKAEKQGKPGHIAIEV